MLKRFLLASAMLFVPLTTFAQNATTQVNGAILNGTPTTILTPWVPNGDGTYSQKVSATTGGGSNAAAGPVNTTAPASASYTGFLSGANIVPVSAANPLPVTGSFSATTTGTATTAAPTYVNNTSNPLSLNLVGGLRVDGSGATQPISGSISNTAFGISGTLPAFAATPAFKVSDTAGAGITSTTIASKQRLDVTLAAGGAPGATASTIADQVGGVDGGGLLRAFSVDATGRMNVQGGNATAVKTDGSAVTQPVSGTVAVTGAYQATQPVSGTVAVTGAYQATQPVSIATMPTTPVTGTFYQATQPVSGTVAVTGAYQATQPVSLATLPALAVGANAIGSITNTAFGITGTLPAFAATPTVNVGTMPSVAVTGTFYQTTQPVSGSVGVSNFPATQAVSITTMPTTPVTGAFYQATQPVSGTVAVTGAYQATQPVSIATMPTTPVTGTFYQATQPVSVAALPAVTQGAGGGAANTWTVGGVILTPTATFTTTAATTAWTSNQLIANSATAGSVVPLTFTNACRVNAGTGSIRRAQIQVASDTGFAGQSLVLALYTVSPTFANGDRATWLTSYSGYIGQMAITLSQHFSDYEQGIGTPVNGSELNFICAGGSTSIYGAVISAGTLTPQAASKAVIASLESLTN